MPPSEGQEPRALTVAAQAIEGRKCAETAKVHPDLRIVYNLAYGVLAGEAGRFSLVGDYTTKFKSPNSFRAFSRLPTAPELAGLRGFASRAAPLPFPQFWPFAASLFSVFICLPRERARGHFLYWRGFSVGWLWLATPVVVATENDAGAKKNRPEAVVGTRCKRAIDLSPFSARFVTTENGDLGVILAVPRYSKLRIKSSFAAALLRPAPPTV